MGPAISFHNHVFAMICLLFSIRKQSMSRANAVASVLQDTKDLLESGEGGGVHEWLVWICPMTCGLRNL